MQSIKNKRERILQIFKTGRKTEYKKVAEKEIVELVISVFETNYKSYGCRRLKKAIKESKNIEMEKQMENIQKTS